MIIAGMSPTEERKKEIAFSNSYYTSEPVVLVQKMEHMPKPKHWMILRELKSPPNKEFTSTI